jgi:lipopolysaccharide transport system permease protein
VSCSFLAWRDIKVRYKQTLLGATWAVLQPFPAMVVFSVFLVGWLGCLQMVYPTRSLPMPGYCRGSYLRML